MSAERDTRRPSRLDPDELAALEEQRDFLLRSITDLDQEHAAGDLEDGDYQSLKDDYTARAAEVLRAIELKPSYADGYGLLARIMHFAGRPQEGREAIAQAMGLSPTVPALYLMVDGALLYQLGRHDEALEQLTTSVNVSPNLLLSHLYLAAAYAGSNRMDEAGWAVNEILSFNPHFTIAYLDYGFPMRDQLFRQRFVDDLRRAGLPDPAVGTVD